MKKWILILLAVGVVAGIGIGLYMYNKPLESMSGQDADVAISAVDLYQAFDTDEATANATYLGKVIEVTGTIQSVSAGDDGTPNIVLSAGDVMGGVVCRLDASATGDFQEVQTAAFRGECTGKLLDVELARCVPIH